MSCGKEFHCSPTCCMRNLVCCSFWIFWLPASDDNLSPCSGREQHLFSICFFHDAHNLLHLIYFRVEEPSFVYRVTEWERGRIHRITDRLRLAGPSAVQPSAQAGTPIGAQGHVQMALKVSKQGDLSTTSLGNLYQCSTSCTVKKCCLMFRGNLLCLFWHGHHWKEPGSVIIIPSLQVFMYADEIPLNLLFSTLKFLLILKSFPTLLTMVYAVAIWNFLLCSRWFS